MNAAQVPPSAITYTVTTGGKCAALAAPARKHLPASIRLCRSIVLMPYEQFLNESLLGLKYCRRHARHRRAVALLLSAIGIFGVMANLVGERTREIGVGSPWARAAKMCWLMILRRASCSPASASALGVALAFGLARLTAGLLFGVRPDDPVVFSSITVAIALSRWAPAGSRPAAPPASTPWSRCTTNKRAAREIRAPALSSAPADEKHGTLSAGAATVRVEFL